MRSSARLLPAVLVCTVALAACGSQPSGDASGGSASSAADGTSEQETATAVPTTGIPDDFPLAAGMGGPADSIPTSRTGTGLRDLELCGTSPLRGLGTRDRMVADNSGGEAADTRELVLLGSPDAATLVAQAFADLPSTCDGSAGTGDMSTTTERRESTFGDAPAAVLVQGYVFDGDPGPGHLVVHVVPVGSALLVTRTYGEWPEVAEGIDRDHRARGGDRRGDGRLRRGRDAHRRPPRRPPARPRRPRSRTTSRCSPAGRRARRPTARAGSGRRGRTRPSGSPAAARRGSTRRTPTGSGPSGTAPRTTGPAC